MLAKIISVSTIIVGVMFFFPPYLSQIAANHWMGGFMLTTGIVNILGWNE